MLHHVVMEIVAHPHSVTLEDEDPWSMIADVLVLDIGRVCMDIDPDACAMLLGAGSMKRLACRWPTLIAAARALETGRLAADAFLAQVVATTRGRYGAAQVEEAWCAILGDEIPGMAELVHDAKEAGLSVILFSDTSPIHYQALLRKLSFAAVLDGAVLSFDVGSTKPSLAMFEAVEQQHCRGGVPRLYVDDKPANIRAAHKRGWVAYRFGDPDGARGALAAALAERPMTICVQGLEGPPEGA